MVDPLERLTNLVAYLAHSRRPLTQAEIVEAVPGYAAGETGRRAFERDKRVLRDHGVPLVEDHGRYAIPEDQFFLPDLDLTEDERAALAVAVAAIPVADVDPGTTLAKLGGGAGALDGIRPQAHLEELPVLPVLHEAASRHAPVTFDYGPGGTGEETRTVDPYSLVFREGFWYLIGRDHRRDAVRTFRVDRIRSTVRTGGPGSFEHPAGFDPQGQLPDEWWRLPGDEPVRATVIVDALLAGKVADEVGRTASVAWRDDGSVAITMVVTNRDAFRTWVLGLLDHAEVTDPPELRAAMVEWLQGMVAESTP